MIDRIRYASNEIRKHRDDPYWWRQRFSSRIAGPLLGKIHGNEGENVMGKDWDNLFILDACRADMFREAIDVSRFDEYDSIHSVGCSSPEWMANTFRNKTYPDTVYVTANPWISKVAPDSFHDLWNLWITEHGTDQGELEDAHVLKEVGLEDVPTIYPDTLNDAVRDAHRRYPNKRLIVHYFQPHAPCVGNADGSRKETIRDDVHPGDDLKKGNVTAEEVWDQYVENLLYVFHHANQLAEDIGGKTVFTADHGELFGEWLFPFPIRGYEHPDRLRHPKLTEVPWAVKTVGQRRKVVRGDVAEHDVDETEIDDRLRNLGYKV